LSPDGGNGTRCANTKAADFLAAKEKAFVLHLVWNDGAGQTVAL